MNCRLPADDSGGNLVEWAWAMNAASSVLGSVLAIIIAIQFGLNVTLACGAAAYLLALAVGNNVASSIPDGMNRHLRSAMILG